MRVLPAHTMPKSVWPAPSRLLRILVWDDRAAGALRCAARLRTAGYRCKVERAASREAFRSQLENASWDLLFCADAFLDDDPPALVRAAGPDRYAPLLYFVRPQPGTREAAPSPTRLRETLRDGASDYILPGDWERLPRIVEYALREGRLEIARQKAEAARAGAEKRLQTVLDHNPDALLLIQAVTGTVLRVNRSISLLLGYGEEELVGRHFSALFPPEEEPTAGALMERLRVRGPVFEGQRFLRADGTVRFLDVTAEMVAWGQTRAILTTLRDADRRRTLEQEIFWNGASADRCAELILWADADGLLCHANETACRTLGFGREELVGKPMAAIDPGFGAGLWPVHWEEVKARGRFHLTTRLRKREGSLLDIEAEVRHLCHAENEYHCLIARPAREGERSRDKSD